MLRQCLLPILRLSRASRVSRRVSLTDLAMGLSPFCTSVHGVSVFRPRGRETAVLYVYRICLEYMLRCCEIILDTVHREDKVCREVTSVSLRLIQTVTRPFHGGNRGSNPRGDASLERIK